MLRKIITFTMGVAAIWSVPVSSSAQSTGTGFLIRNLVSDIPGLATNTDARLLNPWGIAFSSTSPFWISDNHSGLSTLYDGAGAVQSLTVQIPSPAGGNSLGAPTGILFNDSTNFMAGVGQVARFIFSTEDGTIVSWASGTNGIIKFDNSASGAIYKGLALARSGQQDYLYAADFHNGKVDVIDTNYSIAHLAGSFTDPTIPTGFAPFNVKRVGDNLFVTYAMQDENKEDDIGGPGHGYVDIYDTSGNLIKRFASSGVLNSPWDIAVAPVSFGPFGGLLLIGNFGDGQINGFDPQSGTFLGALSDTNGTPLKIDGLWGLAFGNGGKGGNTNTLYFTAGIPGGGTVEDHGLFGSISAISPSPSVYLPHNLVSDLPGLADTLDTNLVNPWGIAFSSTSPFWISDNHAGVSTLYDGTGKKLTVTVNIPPPGGGSGPAAPTGIVFNGTTNFVLSSSQPAKFIFSTEDGTISAWNSGADASLMVDNSGSSAIYKGLALSSSEGTNYLYASDFHNGKVDVFDGQFKPVNFGSAFIDPGIPEGFAPFGIESVGTDLVVTYAMQNDAKEDDVGGPGNGYVDIFDTKGALIRRFASKGPLNSPWGVSSASPTFGQFSGDILIGNFGDGRINAFDPVTGVFIGALIGTDGNPISIPGLWGVKFGNGGSGGATNILYFTAGIPGPDTVEDHGLFGGISALPQLHFSPIATSASGLTLSWSGGTGSYVLQTKTALSDTNWVDVTTTTNTSTVVPPTGPAGFFRIVSH